MGCEQSAHGGKVAIRVTNVPSTRGLEEEPLQLVGPLRGVRHGNTVRGVVFLDEVQHDRIGLPSQSRREYFARG